MQVVEVAREHHRRSVDREERTLGKELDRIERELTNLCEDVARLRERLAGIEGVVSGVLERKIPVPSRRRRR